MHCYGITWLLHVVTHFGFRLVKSQKLHNRFPIVSPFYLVNANFSEGHVLHERGKSSIFVEV